MSRHLTQAEKLFIECMLRKNGAFLPKLEGCIVEEMDDEGMGSLRFISTKNDRRLGVELARAEFMDADDVVVEVTINLDNYGELYELDVWKTDFSPLIRFPSSM